MSRTVPYLAKCLISIAALFGAIGLLTVGSSCTSNPLNEATCRTDSDCTDGSVCRSGYCVSLGDVGSCTDSDDDGYFAEPGCGEVVDCDDKNAAKYPGNTEMCDGLDNNCNGQADELFRNRGDDQPSLGDECTAGEGVCAAEGTVVCAEDGSGVTCDATPAEPQEEVCNEKDDDCNGLIDDVDGDMPIDHQTNPEHCGMCGNNCLELFDNADGVCTGGTCMLDTCEDHHFDIDGDASNGCEYFCQASETAAENGEELPDEDTICDGIDSDCDGEIDEDVEMMVDGEVKKLGDSCSVGVGACANDGTFVCQSDGPGMTCDATAGQPSQEVCDGKDNDCNGTVDDNNPADGVTWYRDRDGDNFGTPDDTVKVCMDQMDPAGYVKQAGDCDDSDSTVHQGAPETCNNRDDDCDGDVDNDVKVFTWYKDSDGDSFGDPANSQKNCKRPGQDWVTNDGDCDDTKGAINPNAKEICDDVDNNCDGNVDEECDLDGDGFCDQTRTVSGSPAVCPKSPPNTGDDCDDRANNVNPNAPETCNGVDDNCNGTVDEGCSCNFKGTNVGVCQNGTISAMGACQQPTNYEAQEMSCDGLDNNCDGTIDEGCNDDGDDYCDATMTTNTSLTICPEGGGDCDDTKGNVYPGATELCDGLDNDCDSNGEIDEGCDDDGDGWCDANKTIQGSPAICSNGSQDCDDTASDVFPGANETCDGKDNDCDGVTDEGCSCVASIQGRTQGVCQNGTVDSNGTCQSPASLEFPDETSCDGLDNDCDGVTDEGCPCDYNSTTDGVCGNGGTLDSNGDCTIAPTGYNDPENGSGSPVCDSLDNDCDGTVDEGGCDCHYDANNNGMEDEQGVCTSSTSDNQGNCQQPPSYESPTDTESSCDGLDNDCDGAVDEGCSCDYNSLSTGVCADQTRDASGTCLQPASWESMTANESSCDGKDNDCDGAVDEGCSCNYQTTSDGVCSGQTRDADGNCQEPANYESTDESSCDGLDNDCDGSTDESLTKLCSKQQGVCSGDTVSCSGGSFASCDADEYGSDYEATEMTCDGLDNDCDGTVDEGCDDDSDDYCDGSMSVSGTPSVCPNGGGDCDDSKGNIHPNAAEKESNSGDCMKDTDGDGYGDDSPPSGVTAGTDCNDGDADLFPGNTETCDDKNNDCDATTDEGCDDDGDGYCDANKSVVGSPAVCPNSPSGTADDCDDSTMAINPGASEVCDDQTDNDCDGNADCADSDCGGDACGTGSGATCQSGVCVEQVCSDQTDNDLNNGQDCSDGDCDGQACGTGSGATCSSGTCVEETCGDNTDNDQDMATDCADSDCDGQTCNGGGTACAGGSCTETACTDGVDNDGDGKTDCSDSDCGCPSGSMCDSMSNTCVETDCDDGTSNDNDSDIDCADSDCSGSVCNSGDSGSACSSMNSDCLEMACSDDVDNDGDGNVDCLDSDCSCPAGTMCNASGDCIETNCSNGVDDDGDGSKDCADSDCTGNTCNGMGTVCEMGNSVCHEATCDDGADNDGSDGVDCADSDGDCTGETSADGGTCPMPGNFEATESSCGDGVDNDADGDVDCADSDCTGLTCNGKGTACQMGDDVCHETDCSDGTDNDGDGTADCRDADDDCQGEMSGDGGTCPAPGNYENPESSCGDMIDNDADGATDKADGDCP